MRTGVTHLLFSIAGEWRHGWQVYEQPGINRIPPREREDGNSKPSPSTTLSVTPLDDPKPVVVPRFKPKPDVGAFKPSPAPVPINLAIRQPAESIAKPTPKTALKPALKPEFKPASDRQKTDGKTDGKTKGQAGDPQRCARQSNRQRRFADGENLPRLPVQQAIFRFALEQSRRIDDSAGYEDERGPGAGEQGYPENRSAIRRALPCDRQR